MHSVQQHTLKTQKKINTGIPQGGVLSPTLFNIYTFDIPLSPKNVQITTYADDIQTLHLTPNIVRPNNPFNHIFSKYMNWSTQITFT